MKITGIAAVCWLILLLVGNGCTASGPRSASDAAGEYIFPTPEGEVEVVILYPEQTYRQEIYRNVGEYLKSANPSFTNQSSWSYKGTALNFNNWLATRDFLAPTQKLLQPKLMQAWPAHWSRPTRKSEATILVAEELPYVFLRVKDRTEGSRIIKQSRGGRW